MSRPFFLAMDLGFLAGDAVTGALRLVGGEPGGCGRGSLRKSWSQEGDFSIVPFLELGAFYFLLGRGEGNPC